MAHIRYFSLSICRSGSFIQQTHTHFQRWALISAASFPFITTLSTFVGIWPVCFSCLTASSSRAQACLVPSLLLAQRGCLIAVLANEYVSLLSRNWPVPGWVQEVILVPGLFFTSCGWGLRQLCTAGSLVTICCLTPPANQPSSGGSCVMVVAAVVHFASVPVCWPLACLGFCALLVLTTFLAFRLLVSF